ncbi:MAG: hypothetical protein ABI683_01705 [Ginsengibacter sp.]
MIRIIAGLSNAAISAYYYPYSDALSFHKQGIEEFNLLLHQPGEYLTNIFHTNYTDYSGFLESSNSFWNDLRTNIIAKALSIFDLFSGQNFFINTLFFDFLIFFGAVYFWKAFIKIFPNHSWAIIVCFFLLPSVLYFTNGIHRDGLIYLSLGIVIYHFQAGIYNKFSFRKIGAIILFLSFILLLRNFVFITLIPAMIAWWLAEHLRKYPFLSFIYIYVLVIILFFSSALLPSRFNLPQHVVIKQMEFIELGKRGASSMDIRQLHPNVLSFTQNAPQALDHALLRPYFIEKLNFLYTPLAIELLCYEVLIFLFVFFRIKNQLGPAVYFCLFFGLSMLLVIGYTIPILGAIVRYRSIYFPFLLLPIICLTDWDRISKLFKINKK